MVHNASFPQPFQSLDRSFELLTTGPGQPVLPTDDLEAVRTSTLPATQVVHILRTEPAEVTDAVWRRVITRLRQGQSVWTVVAAKAMAPLMISAIARYGPASAHGRVHQADLDADVLACLVEELHSMDLGADQIGLWLWRAVGNTACRSGAWARREVRHRRGADPAWIPRTGPGTGRGPVSVLAEALAEGVVSDEGAELIARTRLERTSLVTVAEQMGLSYISARRRRRRAENRLALALGWTESGRGVSAKAA